MVVTKRFYVGAAALAVFFLLVSYLIAREYDASKFGSVESQVRSYQAESEETRLLLSYADTFGEQDEGAFCEALQLNILKSRDRGYALVNRLRDFERANLLADYELVRRQYYLNNVELWLQSTQAEQKCGQKDSKLVLFFTETLRTCNDCLVQGEVLDALRNQCPQIQVITLASDLGLAPIDLAKKRFGVNSAPAIVIDNSKQIGRAHV